jgi:RNA polymerase sigma-70 factor (ECF subfamily)
MPGPWSTDARAIAAAIMPAAMGSPLETTLAQARAARDGDRAALEALFQRYLPRVIDIVALRLGRCRRDLGAIEDIAQESLLDAFRGIDRFREQSEATFRNWIARIVENNVRDQERHRTARKRGGGKMQSLSELSDSSDAEAAAAHDATPSQVAGAREDAAMIESALLQLGERQREVIVLRDRCEMSFEEVAKAMHLKNSESARMMHRRALQDLAVAIQAHQRHP